MASFVKINDRVINVDKIVEMVKSTHDDGITPAFLIDYGKGLHLIDEDKDAKLLYAFITGNHRDCSVISRAYWGNITYTVSTIEY